MKRLLLTLLLVSGLAHTHEQVPTYPKWERAPSIYPGVLTTTIELFNKRSDVEYYEIGVFDKEWKPVYFVADYKVVQLKYLTGTSVDIYIARENRDRAEYVCSRSKIKKDKDSRTALASKICSRFKR